MSRVSTRIRSDVVDGDLVYRNTRGWWVSADEFPNNPAGTELRIYRNGFLEFPTSDDFLSYGFEVLPVTKQAAKEMGVKNEVEKNILILLIVNAVVLAAWIAYALFKK